MSIREIILDTETTGLDPTINKNHSSDRRSSIGHRIIEIGMVEMINKVPTGNIFHTYLNPERDVCDDAYRIHNISTESLKDKPLFRDISDKFLEFIADSRLVIHNAPFDIRFINHELMRINYPLPDFSSTVDTLPMARTKFPGLRVNLDALCRMFSVDNSNRKFHGALKDAYLLAQVYVELTGGRQNSFDLTENRNFLNQDTAININKYVSRKTTSIKPSQMELQLHKEFIEKIAAG